jgi:biopolymer transport protein ExbD
VTLLANGTALIDGQPLPRDEWSLRLAAAARQDAQTELHLRADQAVPYGVVAELIGTAQKAGLTRIGFASDLPTGAAPPAPPMANPPGRAPS